MPCKQHRGRHCRLNALRHGHKAVAVHRDLLGVGAGGVVPSDQGARRDLAERVFHYTPAAFRARDVRGIGGVCARAEVGVDEVDAGVADVDKQLARAGNRRLDNLVLKDLWAAV